MRGARQASDALHGPPLPDTVMTPAILIALALLGPAPSGADSIPPSDSVRREVEVRETVLRHAPDVRRCYQDEGLRRNPELSGKIDLELTILPTGTVDSVNVATSFAGPGQHEVTTCVASRARNWRFDRGPYAVETVVFPFVFTPEERARMDRMVTAAR
jgi:outer membrane biosynthesis protein TonB